MALCTDWRLASLLVSLLLLHQFHMFVITKCKIRFYLSYFNTIAMDTKLVFWQLTGM